MLSLRSHVTKITAKMRTLVGVQCIIMIHSLCEKFRLKKIQLSNTSKTHQIQMLKLKKKKKKKKNQTGSKHSKRTEYMQTKILEAKIGALITKICK